MSNLTRLVRNVVGKTSHSSGRGMSWLYVTDDNGNRLRGSEQANRLIQLMSDNFETWKMTRTFDGFNLSTYFFFVTSKRDGKEFGVCSINVQDDKLNSFVLIDLSYQPFESIHEWNRTYDMDICDLTYESC